RRGVRSRAPKADGASGRGRVRPGRLLQDDHRYAVGALGGAHPLVADLAVQPQVALAAVSGVQAEGAGAALLGEGRFARAQQAGADAVALEAGVDAELADGGGALLGDRAAHRADHLLAEAGDVDAVGGDLRAGRFEGLRRRVDAVVAVEGRLALEAQVLQPEDLLRVLLGRRRDGHAHAHVRTPPAHLITCCPPLLSPTSAPRNLRGKQTTQTSQASGTFRPKTAL